MAENVFYSPLILLLILIVAIVITTSSAESCKRDSDCPTYKLCIGFQCSRGTTGTGNRCFDSTDCPGRICKINECTCSKHYECPGSEICSDDGICINTPTSCIKSYECQFNEVCYMNYCIICTQDYHCPDNEVCMDSKCTNVKNKPCESSSDCVSNEFCDNGRCTFTSPFVTAFIIVGIILTVILVPIIIVLVMKSCSSRRPLTPPPPYSETPPPSSSITNQPIVTQVPVNPHIQLTTTNTQICAPPTYYEAIASSSTYISVPKAQ